MAKTHVQTITRVIEDRTAMTKHLELPRFAQTTYVIPIAVERTDAMIDLLQISKMKIDASVILSICYLTDYIAFLDM